MLRFAFRAVSPVPRPVALATPESLKGVLSLGLNSELLKVQSSVQVRIFWKVQSSVQVQFFGKFTTLLLDIFNGNKVS